MIINFIYNRIFKTIGISTLPGEPSTHPANHEVEEAGSLIVKSNSIVRPKPSAVAGHGNLSSKANPVIKLPHGIA
jgi:hypothetical protein